MKYCMHIATYGGWTRRVILLTCLGFFTLQFTGCRSVDFEAQKRSYIYTYDTLSNSNMDEYDLPELSVNKNRGYQGRLGQLYFDNGGPTNSNVLIDITRQKSTYKASAPLFHSDNYKVPDISLKVKRNKEVVGGIEFSYPISWFQ